MKVKKFNNLWAMGLILCGVLLVAFYLAKIFFPEFIVGVAEIPAIVNFALLVMVFLFNKLSGVFQKIVWVCQLASLPTYTQTALTL